MQQSRFRSKAAWASLLSLVGLCLAEVWQTLTTALLATLTAFGVLNNPTDGENF